MDLSIVSSSANLIILAAGFPLGYVYMLSILKVGIIKIFMVVK